jgi:hypothetical protein
VKVGVNYPWVNYGWDFGTPPPGWRTAADPDWMARIDGDLARFKHIGISVVRWFVLGDGLTYGTASDAPQFDQVTGQWHFNPPNISEELLVHFEALLQRFQASNATATDPVLLMPVFVDYMFCEPGVPALGGTLSKPGFIKQGRAQAINDSTKQAHFLQRALQPLLQIASVFRSTIYAWDIINEPEWVTNNWHRDGDTRNHPIDEDAMRAFIQDGKTMIRRFDFKSTIGFWSIDTIRRTHIDADINQFHFYSDSDPKEQRRLEEHSFSPDSPGIIGEFASAATKDHWPDLKSQPQTVLNRLKCIASKNYPLALVWSFSQGGGRDAFSQWGLQVERDIECFVFGRNCTQRRDAVRRLRRR